MGLERSAILKKISEWISKNWVTRTFLVKISAVWYSLILGFLGTYLHLLDVDNNGYKKLTVGGWIVTILILLFDILVSMADRYAELNDDTVKELSLAEYERSLYQTINRSVGNICQTKCNHQIKSIKEFRDNPRLIPKIYTRPCEQIGIIISEISTCTAELLSGQHIRFNKEDFKINIVYNFPLENKKHWAWAEAHVNSSMSPKDITNPNSTFGALLSENKQSVLFFNSKQEAFNQGCYIKTKDDEERNGSLLGSIACFYLHFGDGNSTYIRAMVGISTNRKNFVDSSRYKDKDPEELEKALETVKINLQNNIINNYQYRIGIELCNHYTHYLYKQSHNSK